MNWKSEYKPLLWVVGFFLFAFFMPLQDSQFRQSIYDSLALTQRYAEEHVLLCLVPAFFIAGTIARIYQSGCSDQIFRRGSEKMDFVCGGVRFRFDFSSMFMHSAPAIFGHP